MSEYGWVEVAGRQVYRRRVPLAPDRRSDLPCPHIMGDTMDPIRSMANGKIYDSKAALRASYLPGGNPQGERFVEIGNEEQKAPPRPMPDRGGIRDSIGKAFAQAGIPD
ncbi:hypothetical protein [Xanthobacter autotrophicus]|uniref:hypothetical protein n=1 Tax=Xanthobacter autotrophicus TaxID=280 RepID=UPI00372C8FD6